MFVTTNRHPVFHALNVCFHITYRTTVIIGNQDYLLCDHFLYWVFSVIVSYSRDFAAMLIRPTDSEEQL